MNYWGDLNISTLSGSFGSLMKEKWEREGEKDKGGRTNGRKEEVEEKEIEGGRKDGGDRRGKGAERRERQWGGILGPWEKLSKFLQANHEPPKSDF